MGRGAQRLGPKARARSGVAGHAKLLAPLAFFSCACRAAQEAFEHASSFCKIGNLPKEVGPTEC